MTELLSLSRAARLAGVSRGDLQRQIRQGAIATFEGQVALKDLLRLYPSVSLEKTGMLEEVQRIKDDATPRLGGVDTQLPSPQVLLTRLRTLAEALGQRVALVDAQANLLDALRARLVAMSGPSVAPAPDAIAALIDWLDAQRAALAVAPGHTQLLAKDTVLRIMSASVKIIPSGHEFLVEGTDSILEAAVRAGVRIGYGCASGNCGECKARVLTGEVSRIREHDYVLSEREKRMGYVLTCSNTAVTDIVLEAAEAQTPADLPEQTIRAQVRKLESERDGLLLLHVQTPRTQTLRFMAGQRARLQLESGASAELAIASCPCNGRNLQFIVRAGSDAFSQDVHDGVSVRQAITVTGPYGSFVLREDNNEPAVFIAIDDGIAPIKSLIEHAVSIDNLEAMHLYWSVAEPVGHYQERWSRALVDALDNFHFTPLVAAAAVDLAALIQVDLPIPTAARYYLAGPAAALGAMTAVLADIGIPPERLVCEYL